MHVEAYCNEYYAILAYSVVGLACYLIGKNNDAWWRAFLFAPLTMPFIAMELLKRGIVWIADKRYSQEA